VKNTLAVIALLSTGCTLLPDSIPIEASHTSHISQHLDGSGTNWGWETLSAGFRWRRHGITLDILDGYSVEKVDGRHEVFNARISTEIPLK
jgi:hypothetical protein